MKKASAAKRSKIAKTAVEFEISESLRKFLPPTTEFSMGVRTPWFNVPKIRTNSVRNDEEQPRKTGTNH